MGAAHTLEELRTAFLDARCQSIREDNGPVQLAPGPKVVVHLYSATETWPGTSQRDVQSVAPQLVPLMDDMEGAGSRMSFDGRLWFQSRGSLATSTTLLMHTGMVEAVKVLVHPDAPEDFRGISLLDAESSVVQFASQAVNGGLVQFTAGFPLLARVTLVETANLPADEKGSSTPSHRHRVPVRQTRPLLVLPEVRIENDRKDVSSILPGALQRMWHAWGYAGSPTYRELNDGLWARKHRP